MNGGSATRSTEVEDGVRATSARVGAFEVHELVFPDRHASFLDPEEGYVAIVLEGGVEKTFARSTRPFHAGRGLTMPVGAAHASRFAPGTTTVVSVKAPGARAAPAWTALLADVRELREAACVAIGWRLAAELRAHDDAWPLAVESLCLELVASLVRDRAAARAGTPPPWLETVREQVHVSLAERHTVAGFAAEAGVHPAHLARSFRRRYGVSIGEYVRRTRLSWAAAQLTSTDTPLAVLAAEAGFADQSHFTRAFKQHTGLTPGRYRAVVRS